jgi:hypothetical protein
MKIPLKNRPVFENAARGTKQRAKNFALKSHRTHFDFERGCFDDVF